VVKTMRAMVMHRHGGPEVLTLEAEWPRPEPGLGEILVEVHACALNFLDIFTREGMPGEPTPLPHITGGDVAGIVAAVGAGVVRPAVGARVLIDPNWGCGACEYCRGGERPRCIRGHMLGEMDPGGLAEYVTCPASQAIAIPEGVSFDAAACLPVAWGTAWRMVVTHARPKPDDVVLVLGAGGGVGLAAVQIAKLMGARVIATASTDDKLARIGEYGADHLVNYASDERWDATVRALTGKRGADVIIETVGAATWERSIRALGKGGRLVTSGVGPHRTDGHPLSLPPRAAPHGQQWLDARRAAARRRARLRGQAPARGRPRAAARRDGGGRDRARAPAGLRQGHHPAPGMTSRS
jgi:NADPH:quinone reductase-like Zn-dependent oxidoreductase